MSLTVAQVTAFEEYVANLMKEHKMPGLAVGIACGDEVVYKKGFGVKDLVTKAPVTTKTIFGVASVTKSFTGTAIMKLCEEGKMSVHDPVKRFLPEFDISGGSGDLVTSHHCLTHTTGLPPLPSLGWGIRDNTKRDVQVQGAKEKTSDPRFDKPHPPVTTYSQLMDYLRTGDFTVLGEPGEYCSYSNEAYGVLGAVIEKVSGEMYARYMEQNILVPLGMKRSTFNLEEILKDDDVTTLYYREEAEDEEILSSNNWQVAPAYMACGWLKSCVDDLLNYVRWHASGGKFGGLRVLSEESLDAMAYPHTDYNRDKQYGYGLGVQDGYHGVTIVDHSGGLKGVSSQIGWIKSKGISAVVLCNLSGAPSNNVLTAAFNMMLGLPLDTPRSVYRREDWTKEQLEELTGTFESGEGGQITLVNEDGKLMARYGKEAKVAYEVRRDSENIGVVTVRGQDNQVIFLKNADGKLWAIGSGGRIIRKS